MNQRLHYIADDLDIGWEAVAAAVMVCEITAWLSKLAEFERRYPS